MHQIRRRLCRISIAASAYQVLRHLWCYPAFAREFFRFKSVIETFDGELHRDSRWWRRAPACSR